jgi:hypothetical protein
MLKIIRLNSGDDIIANVSATSSEDNVSLEYPFDVTTIRTDNGVSVMLMPWLPIEFIDDNTTIIPKKEILLSMNPSKKLTEYYHQSLDSLIKKLIRIESQTGKDDFNDIREKFGRSLVATDSKTVH